MTKIFKLKPAVALIAFLSLFYGLYWFACIADARRCQFDEFWTWPDRWLINALRGIEDIRDLNFAKLSPQFKHVCISRGHHLGFGPYVFAGQFFPEVQAANVSAKRGYCSGRNFGVNLFFYGSQKLSISFVPVPENLPGGRRVDTAYSGGHLPTNVSQCAPVENARLICSALSAERKNDCTFLFLKTP